MNITLAISLPVAKSDFLAALNEESSLDFARSIKVRFRGMSDEFLWAKVYRPRVEFAKRSIERLSRAGVNVVVDCTHHQMRSIFNEADVVVLLAHWKAANFSSTDIINEQQVELVLPDLPRFGGTGTDQKTNRGGELVDSLNGLLDDQTKFKSCWPGWISDELSTLKMYRQFANRFALDELLGTSVRPGNRIEFHRDMVGLSELEAAIPSGFTGVLDFAVCNSALVGEYLGLSKPYRVRVNKKPSTIEARLAILEATVQLSKCSNLSYLEADNEVRLNLLEHLQKA